MVSNGKRGWLLALAIVSAGPWAAGSAHAITGAEMLANGEGFGVGYVWGVIDSAVTLVPRGGDVSLIEHRRDCVQEANLRAGVAYDGVKALIERQPDLLRRGAPAAVITFLVEMCGPPPG